MYILEYVHVKTEKTALRYRPGRVALIDGWWQIDFQRLANHLLHLVNWMLGCGVGVSWKINCLGLSLRFTVKLWMQMSVSIPIWYQFHCETCWKPPNFWTWGSRFILVNVEKPLGFMRCRTCNYNRTIRRM